MLSMHSRTRTPSPSRAALIALLLLGTAASSVACTDDFEPKSKVLYTRIIGVKSAIPRMQLGETTELSALVVSPDPDDQLELRWEVCPLTGGADDGYPCEYPFLPPEMVANMQSTGETFSFTYDIPLLFMVDTVCDALTEAVAELPAGLPIPDCTQGFPARVRLTVRNLTTDEEVAAVKTLYLTQSSAEHIDNQNPRISELTPSADAPPVAKVGEAFPVRCALDETSLERFSRFDETELRDEEMLISWYVRGGKLDKDLSLYSEEYGTVEEAEKNDLFASDPGTATIWCVVRDGRGGANWASLEVTVQ